MVAEAAGALLQMVKARPKEINPQRVADRVEELMESAAIKINY